jgi:hypothetical protein
MPDKVNARNEPLTPFPKPSEASHQCVLCDVVDLGYRQVEYMGRKKGFKQFVALVWQIDEENPDTKQRFEVAREFQVTMFADAKLRKLLEQWRGKTYTDAEAEQGVPLDKLYGANGLMQIEHKPSKSHPDRTYTNVVSIVPVPPSMPKMVPAAYTRDNDRWTKAKGITWEQAFPPDKSSGETFDDFPQALEDQDDDLPF